MPGEASWSVHTNTQITKASHRRLLLFRSTRGRSERVKLVGQRSVAAGAELVFRQRCIGLHKE